MSTCPTVKIKNKDSDTGYSLINEADFDPDKHEKFKAKPGRPKKVKPSEGEDGA